MFIKIIYIFIVYIITSIPFAYIFSKSINKVDIRTLGSKNIGATNAFRTAGYIAGILTLVFDIFKGWLSIYFAKKYIDSSFIYITGIIFVAIIGHIFSIFIKFKGGKGVAVSLGLLIPLLHYLPLLISIFIFVLIFIMFNYVSLSSIIAAISLPFTLILLKYQIKYIIVVFLIVSIIIYKHKNNIIDIIKKRRERDSNPR
ncbi:MAG: glycerol-3-phosphate 1-O-acyltransferase PlsY [Methanobrevibacter sp.]|nr:glycerol-3-phosphate 1-O-acyltransferase PlsY [Candidatus Methanoflexus mossambicus]